MAHAAFVKNASMSLGATELATYISSVEHRHWDLMHSLQNSIRLWILTLVSLRLMPYESHRASKWSLKSLLVILFFVLLPIVVYLVTGNSTNSNQLEAGSIIVRHMNLISVSSLPRRVYGTIRSTHRASHGVVRINLVGSFPYC